jgi:hypothetical protein
MKNLKFLLFVLLPLGILSMSSCSKDATPPTIKFTQGTGYTSGDVSVPVNSILKIGITARAGSSKLANFKATIYAPGSQSTPVDSTFSGDTFARDFTITTPDQAGTGSINFVITDADGQTAAVSINITTTAEPINVFTAILMGGQQNADLGSFYSTGENVVMNLGTARQNAAKADLVYYYGTTNQASIVAVSDAQLGDVPVFAECTSWLPKNDTKFKLMTGIDWATITDESGIKEHAVNLTETHINNLAIGNIVAFETAATSTNPGKKGLYKVVEINGTSGADRSIKLEIKIQK